MSRLDDLKTWIDHKPIADRTHYMLALYVDDLKALVDIAVAAREYRDGVYDVSMHRIWEALNALEKDT